MIQSRSRAFIAIAGLFVAVAAAGCGTVKGVGRGVGAGACCVADGVKEDAAAMGGIPAGIKKADNWIRENLW